MRPFVIGDVRQVANHNVKRTRQRRTHVMPLQCESIRHAMIVRICLGQRKAIVFHINANTSCRGERVKQRHDHSAAAHAKFKDVGGMV